MLHPLHKAVDLINNADAIIVLAGAGMSADSGIPVYRGVNGVWQNEVIIKERRVSLADLNTHKAYIDNYDLAWEFIIHRIDQLKNAFPHEGYKYLLSICKQKPYYIVTTNVDSFFERAHFDENSIVEIHGTLNYFQCLESCESDIWLMPENISEMPPKCPICHKMTRPNIRLFEDWHWLSTRSRNQEKQYKQFIKKLKENHSKAVVLEIGAGSKLPYLRQLSERLTKYNWPIIRINPFETDVDGASVVIKNGAKKALMEINSLLV